MQKSTSNTNARDEKLLRVMLKNELEICSLAIISSLKLDKNNTDMLKSYITIELNERLNLIHQESLSSEDYELKLSKVECTNVKELYDEQGFFIIEPKKDISEIILRQKLIENLIEMNCCLDTKMLKRENHPHHKTRLNQNNQLTQQTEQNKQKRSFKSSIKHDLQIEIEKVNLKFENYKIENEYRIKNDLKDLKEIFEIKYTNRNKYFEKIINEVKDELNYLKNENKNLVNLLNCFNEAIFRADFYIDSFNKRNLIKEFVKKCSLNSKINQKDLTLKNIDIDKYNLKRDDLSSILMFGLFNNQVTNLPIAREIALSILTTSVNKDSWKRIFKATFDLTPEEILLEDDSLFV